MHHDGFRLGVLTLLVMGALACATGAGNDGGVSGRTRDGSGGGPGGCDDINCPDAPVFLCNDLTDPEFAIPCPDAPPVPLPDAPPPPPDYSGVRCPDWETYCTEGTICCGVNTTLFSSANCMAVPEDGLHQTPDNNLACGETAFGYECDDTLSDCWDKYSDTRSVCCGYGGTNCAKMDSDGFIYCSGFTLCNTDLDCYRPDTGEEFTPGWGTCCDYGSDSTLPLPYGKCYEDGCTPFVPPF